MREAEIRVVPRGVDVLTLAANELGEKRHGWLAFPQRLEAAVGLVRLTARVDRALPMRAEFRGFSAKCEAGRRVGTMIAALKSVRESWAVPPGLESLVPLYPALRPSRPKPGLPGTLKRGAKVGRPCGTGNSRGLLHRVLRNLVLTHMPITHMLKRCATQKLHIAVRSNAVVLIAVLALAVCGAGGAGRDRR